MKKTMLFRAFAAVMAVGSVVGGLPAVAAEFTKGSPAPEIAGLDLAGKEVRLSSVGKENPYLVILYFFSKNTGEDIAAKLQYLQATQGRTSSASSPSPRRGQAGAGRLRGPHGDHLPCDGPRLAGGPVRAGGRQNPAHDRLRAGGRGPDGGAGAVGGGAPPRRS